MIAAAAAFVAAVSFATMEQGIAIASCLLGWTMLAIAVSDMRRFLIPDVLSLPAIPIGLLVAGWLAPEETRDIVVLQHTAATLAGAACFYVIGEVYRRVRGRIGLGLGDVKLVAVAGAWNGLEGLSFTILIGCAAAISYVLLQSGRKASDISATTPIPFGAFLAPSIWFVWIADHATIG